MELQKGNTWAAVKLLERSVVLDPSCSPVLNWKPVSAARQSVIACVGRRACLVAGGGGGVRGGGVAGSMGGASASHGGPGIRSSLP